MSLKYSNPTTSFAAAVDNLPRAGTQRRMILDAIRAEGTRGLTRDELEVFLDLSGNAVRPRVRELQDEGHIEEDTERTRTTRSGSQAAVLVAVNSGVGADPAPEQVVARVSTDSGVEASSHPSPSPASEAPPANPYEYEVWA